MYQTDLTETEWQYITKVLNYKKERECAHIMPPPFIAPLFCEAPPFSRRGSACRWIPAPDHRPAGRPHNIPFVSIRSGSVLLWLVLLRPGGYRSSFGSRSSLASVRLKLPVSLFYTNDVFPLPDTNAGTGRPVNSGRHRLLHNPVPDE